MGATSRYLQPDPLGMPDGPSRWAYVTNSPLMRVDPEGLFETGPKTYSDPGSGSIRFPSPLFGRGGSIVPLLMIPILPSVPSPVVPDAPDVCVDKDENGCPPCKTKSGKIVPVGTIAYRPLENPPKPQHGIDGPHYNIYRANQNPNDCRCFWQPIGAVTPTKLPIGAIPIEEFSR